jgi:hypothetical protein
MHTERWRFVLCTRLRDESLRHSAHKRLCPQVRLDALPFGVIAAVIKVQHVLPIRLNIHPTTSTSLNRRRSFNATAKNAITNTCPSNDMIRHL